MTTVSRTTTQGKDQDVISGIDKELQSMTTMFLGGEVYTPDTLVALVQSRIYTANAIAAARAAWEDTLAAYDVLDRKVNVVLGDLRHLVMAAFGRETPKLASFGFPIPKLPTMTTEQRAIAARKAYATRKARKTMGKKQKALVKGEAAAAPAERRVALASDHPGLKLRGKERPIHAKPACGGLLPEARLGTHDDGARREAGFASSRRVRTPQETSMPTHHHFATLTSLPVAQIETLLVRALFRGDGDDAERASIELYLLLLEEMDRSLPRDDAESAPCLVATLMFAMARRCLTRPGGTPAPAVLAVPRPFAPNHLTA